MRRLEGTLTMLFAAVAIIGLVSMRLEVEQSRADLEYASRVAETAQIERDNAEETARELRRQFDALTQDYAAMQETNAELAALLEESRAKAATEEESEQQEEAGTEPEWHDAGEFRIYHYCPCEKCNGKWAGRHTASGTVPTASRTIAVDPDVIPLGSEVLINGSVYIAEDTGTGISGKKIDLFVDSHSRALELGTYLANVKWREREG